MPDASTRSDLSRIDLAFVASLMLHPSRRALLVLDAGGQVARFNKRFASFGLGKK